MTSANTILAADHCTDCEDSIREGYAGCGDCCAPDEPWEATIPREVWEV